MSTDAYLTGAERQAAARDAYERSVDEGEPLTSVALAAQFDRSDRWAQDRMAEVRSARSADGGEATERAGKVGDGTGQRLDAFIVSVVALVTAAASYEHQRSLAVLAGEGALAWVLPISVDGMMLATSRSILRRRRNGVPVPFLSWFGFALGFIASVAANVAAADPTLVGRLLAAWPPVALFIAYETLAADHGEFRQR